MDLEVIKIYSLFFICSCVNTTQWEHHMYTEILVNRKTLSAKPLMITRLH